jgi:hypothetical protein
MRSFFAFLACTGFIVWAHSRDSKIVGLPSVPAQQDLVIPEEKAPRELLFFAASGAQLIHPQAAKDTLVLPVKPHYPSQQ